VRSFVNNSQKAYDFWTDLPLKMKNLYPYMGSTARGALSKMRKFVKKVKKIEKRASHGGTEDRDLNVEFFTLRCI